MPNRYQNTKLHLSAGFSFAKCEDVHDRLLAVSRRLAIVTPSNAAGRPAIEETPDVTLSSAALPRRGRCRPKEGVQRLRQG